jgi:hypothetical protein
VHTYFEKILRLFLEKNFIFGEIERWVGSYLCAKNERERTENID